MTANGGASLGLANARGGNAGTIAVTASAGAINFTNGNLSAVGGNAVAGVATGGAAKNISLSATGNVTTNTITLGSGAAFGTAAPGGTAATLSVSGANVSLGAITATGGLDGNGSAVTINAGGTLTTGGITDNGGGGTAGTAGGNAGTVSLTSNGAISTGALTASGGSGGAGTAAGGNAGTISVTNSSTTSGTLTTGALSAQTGAATGATISGARGSISVTNHAPTLLQVGAIGTWGTAGAAGGDVSLVSAGNVTSGVISTFGGTLNAGTASAGRAGGSVIIDGIDRSIPSITTFGGAAVVSGFGGSAGGNVVMTGSDGTAGTAGLLSVPSGITTFSGAALGTGAGAAAGSVRLEGTTVSTGGISAMGIGNGAGGTVAATASSGALSVTGTINTFGSAGNAGSPGGAGANVTLQGQSVTTAAIDAFGGAGNGADQAGAAAGAVSALASGGNLSVGAIYAYGGNGGSGNASGGNGGAITLDAPGAGHTITIGGITLMSSGGSSTGTGTAGAGATVSVKNAALLGTTPIQILATGGNGGGDIHFYGTLDSSGAASALTTSSNGVTTFDGAIGASSRLASLTANGGGTTVVNGGSVLSTGTQVFSNAVTLGADTAFDAGASALAFSSTIDGAHNLNASTTGVLTFSGAIGAVTPLTRLVGTAQTLTIADATINGGVGGAISLTGTRNIVGTGSLTSNGAPITLAGNATGTATGTFIGVALTGATLDAGGGSISVTGTGGTVGAGDHGIVVTNSSLKTTGGGTINVVGAGRGTSGIGVSIGNAGATQSISSVDGNIQITGTGAATALDVAYSGYAESSLQASGLGNVALTALGSGDANGLSIGTTGSAFDYYGPALNRWQLSTASNLVFSGLGVTKTTGGDGTLTLSAAKGISFTGIAGINASSGKLDLIFDADRNSAQNGYVSLASGTFNSNGGNILISGGTDPTTGYAWGDSASAIGIKLNGTTLNAGGGNLTLRGHGWSNPAGSHGIYTQSGTTITTTGTGAITLSGVGGDLVTGAQSTGVLLNQVTHVLGQDGDIRITGTGGNNTGGSFGVYLDNFQNGTYGGTSVISSGTGRIFLLGTGGNTTSAGGNNGYVMNFNSLVQSAYGDITISGTAGSSSGSNNNGISWDASGTIQSTGIGPNAAKISVTGTGGGGANNNWGIFINSNKVIAGLNSFATACSVTACNGPTITSIDGDISIRGVGGAGAGSGSNGINFANFYGAAGATPVQITGLGAAAVSVTGLGGSGTTGGSGLQLVSGGGGGFNFQTAGSGNLTVTGVGGSGGNGIAGDAASILQTTGTGNLTLLVDSMVLGAANTISSATALTIRPFTNGTSVGVGSAAGGSLALSDAELGQLSWGSTSLLTIGGASAGATTVNTPHVFANPIAIVSGAGADITLAAALTSSSGETTPTITLAAGRNFVNTIAGAAIDPGAGVWRLYSSDPAADTRGGLAPDFKQYAATYGATPVQGSGNGALYRIAPGLTPGLTGATGKVYDGNAMASLAPANYTVTGAIDGDSVVVGNGSAVYDTRDVGNGKLVTASGIAVTSASNGAIPVYGYALASPSAAASIGTITPALLTLSASADTKVYDGNTSSAAAPVVVSGLAAGDTVTSMTQVFDSRNTGSRTLTVTGYTVNDGNGGANYSISGQTAAGAITPAPLLIQADDKTRLQGQPQATLTASFSGFVAGETPADLAGTLLLGSAAGPSSAPGSYAIVVSGLSSSNYAIRYLDGLYDVLAPLPPAIATTGALGQRDLRLMAPTIGGVRCVQEAIEMPTLVRRSELPLLTEPRCAPTGARKEKR
ncbi:MAG TPA: YDG domain-containing protein [Caldimonas sp.]